MDKPIKPKKKIEQPGSRVFYDMDHTGSRVSIEYFNQWIKDNLPKDAYDITLTLDEDYDYYSGEITAVYLRIEYKVWIDNPRYKSEIKKYEKQLAKWKKQCQK